MRTRPPCGQRLDHRLGRAGAQAAAGRKGQLQHPRAGQPLGQHRGQAIAGHDVEADGRQQGHAGRRLARSLRSAAHTITSISPVMSR